MPGPLAGLLFGAISFFVGAIPWGYLAGRVTRGIDIRAVGSGGTGATNVLRTLGGRASAIVLLLDFLKGAIPVLLAKAIGLDPVWVGAAAVATVAGHCWSPFIGFKGGKGMATGAGASIVLFPPLIAVVPIVAIIVWLTKYVSLGSLVAAALGASLAVLAAAVGRLEWPSAAAITLIALIIFIRHRENILRLLTGGERRIGETVSA